MKPWVPLLALGLALSPLAFVRPVGIDGESMLPQLRPGQICWVRRGWWTAPPQRGEIWLVKSPDGHAVKRVVGLPGDRLDQRRGDLLLNGQPFQEPYVERVERGDGGPWLAGNGFLLLGDNRPESRDGRSWGPLPPEAFEGKLLNVPSTP